jgi:hypothetical protein
LCERFHFGVQRSQYFMQRCRAELQRCQFLSANPPSWRARSESYPLSTDPSRGILRSSVAKLPAESC